MDTTPGPSSSARPNRRGVRRAAVIALGLAATIAAVAVLAPAVHLATTPRARIRLAGRTLDVAVADTLVRQVWGLQGRTTLGDGEGMLFAFDSPRAVTFSRRSVPFALDVVFVGADRRVTAVGVLDATHDEARSPGAVRWVVEIPRGWARRRGVRVGSLLEPSP